MKITYKNIPKFNDGNKFWYEDIPYFDPNNYVWEWDTKAGLKKGDVRQGFKSPWASRTAGLDPGRYTPTNLSPEYGVMGQNKSHYKYTLEVEAQPYYKDFTEALFDKDNKITPVGMEYIRLSDDLLPVGHNARILDANGNIKKSITVKLNDAHGRAPQVRTFNLQNPEELKAYINHVRNDLTVGGRHNVFPKVGKRYFYYDELGNVHWVDPEEAKKYETIETPDEGFDDKGVYWYDYELKAPTNGEEPKEEEEKKTQVLAETNKYNKFDWNKINQGLLRIFGNPNLYAFGRLAGNLINNERVYGEALKGIRPNLIQTYNTHRQVVGDEATKLAYYRRAAQGETKAARPFTSDADRLMAYLYEAKRIGDELRALGDLADNQEIRRTSDESNLHQWANTQRATEVANTNIAAINLANAARHNLLSLKHAALWSSIDNFLKGIEYRKRQLLAELQAFDDQIFGLQLQLELLTNPKIIAAKKKLQDVIDKHTDENSNIDYNNEEVTRAMLEYKKVLYEVTIDLYRQRKEYFRNRNLIHHTPSYKSGYKITKKRKLKDDLLYKSTRDVVEHFRKMSKIVSDDSKKKGPKIEKLTPHPKGSSKKYLYGGTAPFTIYTPVAMGGESSTTTQTENSDLLGRRGSGSSKSDKGTSLLEVVKDLFKSLEGLPADVNGIYKSMNNFLQRALLFGSEMSSDDLANIYLLQMLKITAVKFNKALFDEASKNANSRDALGEYAIDNSGRIAAQNSKTGKVEFMKWEEIEDKEGEFIPLTNQALLNLRAYSPDLAFNYKVLEVVNNNGIGMSKVMDYVMDKISKIGSSEKTIEGYTKKESDDIKSGMLVLLAGAPKGSYEYTEYTKNLDKLAKLALAFLAKTLPRNMKNVLQVNADVNHTNIIDILKTSIDYTKSDNSRLEFTAVTGKAAKDTKGSGSSEEDFKDVKSNPLMLMVRGQGGVPRTYDLITSNSNVKMSVDGMFYSLIPKVTDDTSIDKMLSDSGISGILDSKYGITFGDLHISPDNLKDIMYSNTGGMVVTLPCKIVNGHKEVNLGVKKSYEEAVNDVESKGISKNSPEYALALGAALKKKGLTSLLDSRGYPNRDKFALFLIVEGYATTKVKGLDTSSNYIEKVRNPDSQLEERMIRALSTNDKKDNYSLDIDYWIWGDDVYRGTVFIPLTNNLNATVNAWGDLVKVDESTELENRFLNFNKASTMKTSNSKLLYERK